MSSNKSPRYDPGPHVDAPESSTANTLVPYGHAPEERTPLLPGKTERKRALSAGLIKWGILLAFLSFIFVNLGLHFTWCPLYPSAMLAVRRDWEKAVAQHDLLRGEWELEERNHDSTVDKWKRETEWHEKDMAHRIREENERQERVRKEWAQEYERHVCELKEYEEAIKHRVQEEQERQERVRKEWDQEEQEHGKEVARRTREEEERQKSVRKDWDQEVQEHEKEVVRRNREEEERQQRVRMKWAQEAEQHRHECDEMERHENKRREDERQKWQREVEDHDRNEEERRKREEEERQKLNMFWGRARADACTTYATREYTAQLMNLPATWEHRVEACEATPLEIHGVSYLPKSCEDKGPGAVIGRWEIDQHEPDCNTFWNWYKDKGCTSPGSGKRRIEHYLENLPRGSDWREFCATTPARFHGMQFSGAQECFQQNFGTYGHWEIDDVNCQ